MLIFFFHLDFHLCAKYFFAAARVKPFLATRSSGNKAIFFLAWYPRGNANLRKVWYTSNTTARQPYIGEWLPQGVVLWWTSLWQHSTYTINTPTTRKGSSLYGRICMGKCTVPNVRTPVLWALGMERQWKTTLDWFARSLKRCENVVES